MSDEKLYLIQDTRSFCGDSVMWWRPDGEGYTFRLSDAGRYTKERADRIHASRSTDRPILAELAERAASLHVVAGDLFKASGSSGEGT